MGQGLGLALASAGIPVLLVTRSPREVAAPLQVQVGGAAAAARAADLVLICTPDDLIATVAGELAPALRADQVILHTSGPLSSEVLAPLASTGAALGSFHPLQTIADPLSAPERLAGAYVAVEGDDRAVRLGEGLARRIGLQPFRLAAGAKPLYHAAAVFASNYTIALAGIAGRLARQAGIPPNLAEEVYRPLMAGAMRNLNELGAVEALTGPVRRGDVATLQTHLAALSGEERELYRLLGLAALILAREGGLEESRARAVEAVLRDSNETARP
jgi:predicted short-subunit dehydrogenase-like oxidoreductase (DUF2520 family)